MIWFILKTINIIIICFCPCFSSLIPSKSTKVAVLRNCIDSEWIYISTHSYSLYSNPRILYKFSFSSLSWYFLKKLNHFFHERIDIFPRKDKNQSQNNFCKAMSYASKDLFLEGFSTNFDFFPVAFLSPSLFLKLLLIIFIIININDESILLSSKLRKLISTSHTWFYYTYEYYPHWVM